MNLSRYFFLDLLQEAWYTKSMGRHPATGYLEERLRNVRKRTRKFLATENEVSLKLKKPLKHIADKKTEATRPESKGSKPFCSKYQPLFSSKYI